MDKKVILFYFFETEDRIVIHDVSKLNKKQIFIKAKCDNTTSEFHPSLDVKNTNNWERPKWKFNWERERERQRNAEFEQIIRRRIRKPEQLSLSLSLSLNRSLTHSSL